MRVKRYVVDSMPDALQRIRSDLGKDAVILNTKEVRSGGFLGMFSRKQIEVIAAIDSTDAVTKSQQQANSIPARTGNLPQRDNSDLAPSLAVTQETAASIPSVAVMERQIEEPPINMPMVNTSSSDVKTEEIFNNNITEEIKQMKKMMYTFMNQNNEQNLASELFEKIGKRLSEHEFDSEMIQELFQQIVEQADSPVSEWTEKETYQQVKDQLSKLIQPEKVQGISAETKFIHFVGPTGVGKTTTIAKLAAEQVLKHNKKVGFITSDTYRIAAVEQLRTYATILNVPLEVVYSPQDLKRALDVLEDRDIIFMDTAGRNFRNEMYVSELNSLLKVYQNSETFLVLSLTMKYKDMKAVTENFSQFRINKILFTKKDETDSYGSIFNIIHDFPLHLSYIANGQNVPDDISIINIDELIDQIMEDVSHE